MAKKIQISGVKLTASSPAESKSGLIGWVSCVLDDSVQLDGLTLRCTADGRFTLSFPAHRDNAGRHHPYIRPLDDSSRREIEQQVFKALRLEGGIDR